MDKHRSASFPALKLNGCIIWGRNVSEAAGFVCVFVCESEKLWIVGLRLDGWDWK